MAKSTPSTITLKSGGGDVGSTREAIVASGNTITPGNRVEYTTSGEVANAGTAVAGSAFAIEDVLQGNGITDTYAAASRCFFRYFQKGDEVYAWLASGQNVAAGATLEGAASGQLTALASGIGVVEALEAVNASGGAARIRVRVL